MAERQRNSVCTKSKLYHLVRYGAEGIFEVKPGYCNAILPGTRILKGLLQRESVLHAPLGSRSKPFLGPIPRPVRAKKDLQPTGHNCSEELSHGVREGDGAEILDVVCGATRFRDENDVRNCPGLGG